MSEVIRFIVRDKTTQYVIPENLYGAKKGGSYVEPVDPRGCTPRLFRTRRSAQAFISQWLRGAWTKTVTIHTTGDSLFGSHEAGEKITPEPKPERKRENMEIVVARVVWDENQGKKMDCFVVCKDQPEHPGKIVVHHMVVAVGGWQVLPPSWVCETVDEARAKMPIEYVKVPRKADESSNIIETWM